MLYKYIPLFFGLCIGYSQPTYHKGNSQFLIKDGCKEIKFDFQDKDNGLVFYDDENKYELQLKECWGEKCSSINIGKYLTYKNGVSYEYHYVPKLVFEIIKLKEKQKMFIIFNNVGELKFLTKIKFKEGTYSLNVDKVIKVEKGTYKKKYKYPFIKWKYYEKLY